MEDFESSGNNYFYPGTFKYFFVLIVNTAVCNHSINPVNITNKSQTLT